MTAHSLGENARDLFIIDMVLFCPSCGMQHIDRPDADLTKTTAWTNPPHKSHLCRRDDGGCGTTWRPADVPTNGVPATSTRGKDDTYTQFGPYAAPGKSGSVRILYTNYRGETRHYMVRPIWLYYGSNEYHKQDQWLLTAIDLDRQVMRTFALADIHGWNEKKLTSDLKLKADTLLGKRVKTPGYGDGTATKWEWSSSTGFAKVGVFLDNGGHVNFAPEELTIIDRKPLTADTKPE